MKRPLLLLFFILLATLMHSQSKVDSLQEELGKTKVDSVKIKILHTLFEEYRYDSLGKAKNLVLKAINLSEETKNGRLQVTSYNLYADFLISQSSFDDAMAQYEKGVSLAEKIDFKEGRAMALMGLGNAYALKGDHNRALEYYDENVKDASYRNDQNMLAKVYNNIARVYVKTNDYTKAMEFYTLSSTKHRELGNTLEYAKALGNIGLVLRMLENYKSAENYLIQSDSLFKKLNFQPGRVFILQNLAVIYKNTGKLDEAIVINDEALKTYERMGNLDMVAEVHYNMGNIFWEKENFQEAVNNYQKALEVAEQIVDSVDMAYFAKALGDGYYQLKENNRSKSYYLRAIKIGTSKKLNLILMGAQSGISEIYKEEGDYKKAYEGKNAYANLKDSLYIIEKRDLASDIEAKYQNEQKVKEIELLSTEKNLQALQLEKRVNERNAIIALATIMLLIAGLLYNQFRVKRNANKKLQEVDRLKSNFFANISHEFRTPLTLIKGPIEQLEQNPEEQLSLENVRMIRRNSDRVLTLVNQLLDLSKIEGGSLKLEPEEGDIYQFLRAVTSSFNSLAAQHRVDYRVQIPQTTFWASFDRDKLEKVVNNLLGNAFKFSEDGAWIIFAINFDKKGIEIQVSDGGKGISKEKLPFIFDRFYQGDSSGGSKEKEGSGIGLALTKSLVELMDGAITVTSEVGKGTIFTVKLPLQSLKKVSEELEMQTSVDDHRKVSPFVPKPRPFPLEKADKRNLPQILLVEDNDDMRHYIKEHLINLYRIKEALNGEEGMQKAIADPPDLIITDLMMPKMDGIELCKKLKTDIHSSHVPIIMLTAKAGMENKIEGLETGADDYLTKPFEGKELLVRTKNLIEQRKTLRNLYSQQGRSDRSKKDYRYFH